MLQNMHSEFSLIESDKYTTNQVRVVNVGVEKPKMNMTWFPWSVET